MVKGTLAVAALALVLSLVLTSCGGAGSGGSSGGSSGSRSATSTKASTGESSSGGGEGYGSSSAATTKSGTPGEAIKTVVIKESEFKLSPSSVTLIKPGTYTFKAENKGSTQHSLEIEGKGVKSEGSEEGEA